MSSWARGGSSTISVVLRCGPSWRRTFSRASNSGSSTGARGAGDFGTEPVGLVSGRSTRTLAVDDEDDSHPHRRFHCPPAVKGGHWGASFGSWFPWPRSLAVREQFKHLVAAASCPLAAVDGSDS